ncbi:MAG: DUF4149 domain-containing protein [Anderseniella sp.]|nr:DUF4149 domain-containing protein [Anderseniella sp.]
MSEIALLITALLFGGMVLYSFGFAAFVFKALPADTAGSLIRQAFPHFYLFVMATATAAAALSFYKDLPSSIILAAIAATTVFARQVLMPSINEATDRSEKSRFKRLHTFSVAITVAHIGGAGFVILRMAS